MSDTLFSCTEDDESLSCESEEEAIAEHLEQLPTEAIGDTITVYEFKRQEIEDKTKDRIAEGMAERLLESLDEDYGNPNGYSKVTEAHKTAAREFVDKVLSDYHVWACEIVGQKEVNVLEWLDRNPGYIDEEAEKEIRSKLTNGKP